MNGHPQHKNLNQISDIQTDRLSVHSHGLYHKKEEQQNMEIEHKGMCCQAAKNNLKNNQRAIYNPEEQKRTPSNWTVLVSWIISIIS